MGLVVGVPLAVRAAQTMATSSGVVLLVMWESRTLELCTTLALWCSWKAKSLGPEVMATSDHAEWDGLSGVYDPSV